MHWTDPHCCLAPGNGVPREACVGAILSLVHDAFNVCTFMGLKPMLGIQIPLVWTLAMVSGVYFNNIR